MIREAVGLSSPETFRLSDERVFADSVRTRAESVTTKRRLKARASRSDPIREQSVGSAMLWPECSGPPRIAKQPSNLLTELGESLRGHGNGDENDGDTPAGAARDAATTRAPCRRASARRSPSFAGDEPVRPLQGGIEIPAFRNDLGAAHGTSHRGTEMRNPRPPPHPNRDAPRMRGSREDRRARTSEPEPRRASA